MSVAEQLMGAKPLLGFAKLDMTEPKKCNHDFDISVDIGGVKVMIEVCEHCMMKAVRGDMSALVGVASDPINLIGILAYTLHKLREDAAKA